MKADISTLHKPDILILIDIEACTVYDGRCPFWFRRHLADSFSGGVKNQHHPAGSNQYIVLILWSAVNAAYPAANLGKHTPALIVIRVVLRTREKRKRQQRD